MFPASWVRFGIFGDMSWFISWDFLIFQCFNAMSVSCSPHGFDMWNLSTLSSSICWRSCSTGSHSPPFSHALIASHAAPSIASFLKNQLLKVGTLQKAMVFLATAAPSQRLAFCESVILLESAWCLVWCFLLRVPSSVTACSQSPQQIKASRYYPPPILASKNKAWHSSCCFQWQQLQGYYTCIDLLPVEAYHCFFSPQLRPLPILLLFHRHSSQHHTRWHWLPLLRVAWPQRRQVPLPSACLGWQGWTMVTNETQRNISKHLESSNMLCFVKMHPTVNQSQSLCRMTRSIVLVHSSGWKSRATPWIESTR